MASSSTLIAPKFLDRVVRLLGRPGRQTPAPDLLRRNRHPLEMDFRVGCELAQRLFDLLARVDAARIVIAEMIDVRRHVRLPM